MSEKYGSGDVAFFLVDGLNMLPSAFRGMSFGVKLLTQLTNGFGTTSKANTPNGISEYSLSMDEALLDTLTGATHATLKAMSAASRIVCWGVEGNAAGKHASMAAASYLVGYVPTAANETLIKAKVEHLISGVIDDGEIVQPLAAKTIDWNTTATPADVADDSAQRGIPILSSSVASPSIITTDGAHGLVDNDKVAIFGHVSVAPDINDNPTASEAWKLIGHTVTVTGAGGATKCSIPVNVTDGGTGGRLVKLNRTGGVGYIQVTALAGLTGFIGKIRHSDDASSWADLVTFTNITAAPGKQRVTYAGVCKRYLSFTGDVTGTGSLTVFAGLSRT